MDNLNKDEIAALLRLHIHALLAVVARAEVEAKDLTQADLEPHVARIEQLYLMLPEVTIVKP